MAKGPIVLRPGKSSTVRDELGRKHCSKGADCKHPDGPWLPESEFAKRGAAGDGLRWYCKACGQQYQDNYKTKRWKNCDVCGEPARTRGGSYCLVCEKQATNRHKRTQGGYICVWSPEPEWRDGWFSAADMQYALKGGHWPEGTRFNHMKRGVVLRVVRVAGEQLKRQELEECNG